MAHEDIRWIEFLCRRASGDDVTAESSRWERRPVVAAYRRRAFLEIARLVDARLAARYVLLFDSNLDMTAVVRWCANHLQSRWLIPRESDTMFWPMLLAEEDMDIILAMLAFDGTLISTPETIHA
jgi:hypothetical protein